MSQQESTPTAIVSGSATGIGAACARALASAGLGVLVNYNRSEAEADAVVHTCRNLGVDAFAVRGDVSSDDDCRALVRQAERRWGRLDVLVNNAGVTRFGDPADLDSLQQQDFEAIFAVNVTGAYQLTRAAQSLLQDSTGGAVVNVSSHSGFSGLGSSMAYAASKGALNTLTLSLARSLAPGIRVNAVCPGFVDTRWMSGRLNQEELATFKQRVAQLAPLKCLVTPEQVAEAVAWFALHAQAITGQLLVIDGGTHLTVGDPI